MKAYMAFDRHAGSGEGAMLVFAANAQEARKASFGVDWHWGEDWTSWTATLIRDLPEHLAALGDGTPMVISSPPTCKSCKCWGGHPMKWQMCSLCWDEEYAQELEKYCTNKEKKVNYGTV